MLRKLMPAGLAFVAATIVALASVTTANADSWKKLATQDIDLNVGTDSIDLTSIKGKYKALRIYVKRAPIYLKNVKVVYALGRVHNENRGINLLSGERTRPINLLSNGRFINRIDLTYRTRNRARRASQLTIWGLQAPGDANAKRLRDKVKDTVAAIKNTLPGAAATTPEPPPETDAGSVFFGVKSVGFGVDRDEIRVGRQIGKFDKIRLRVEANDIFLNRLEVVYGNGTTDTLTYEEEIKTGNRSRWFKLKGDRFISKIVLNYRSKPNFRGRARVEVFGEYAEGWLGSGGPGSKFNRGWVFLGGQSPLFFSIRKGLGYEKDVVLVGRNKGGFRKIRVDVRDRAITLREMTVVYGDGTVDIIPVKKKISGGTSYGPVDLQGVGRREIKEIRVRYRSRLFDSTAQGKSYAFVEFWGKH